MGFIRYSERRRPILRVRELVKGLELDPRFLITAVGAPERLVTDEGEYAALVTVDGLLLEAPVRRTMAYVFLDDCYSVIDGLALRAEEQERFAQQVRLLALHDAHLQGELRRRRFVYQAPRGWSGVASFLHAYWFPEDYPRDRSNLTVAPAIPVPRGSMGFTEMLAQHAILRPGFAVDSVEEPTALANPNKLNGSAWEALGRFDGALGFRDVHILDDGRFAYAVVLESPRDRRDANLALLRAVTDSVEPIPHPGRSVSADSRESVDHWAE
jgi:hypothetical protein